MSPQLKKKPKIGQWYYRIFARWNKFEIFEIEDLIWEGDEIDKGYWKNNLVFLTKKSAQQALKEIKRVLKAAKNY